MDHVHRRLLAVLLLVALALSSAPAQADAAAPADAALESCSVPCGYIYPLITIAPDEAVDVRDLPEDGNVSVDATLTWRFDIENEGFTAHDPTKPITVSFEFPRKPGWAGISVTPNQFEVPISPEHIEPTADDPADPQAEYRYTHDITVTFSQQDQPTLQPGRDVAKLLVFAKSTESGLYKPSYGIKEFRFDPEGAVVQEEDQEVDAVRPGAQPLPDLTRSLGAADVTLEPLDPVRYFEPTTFRATVTGPGGDPVADARVGLHLVDADGDVVQSVGPRQAPNGVLISNLTFPEPGAYRAVVTAAPPDTADVRWTPAAVALPLTPGPLDQGPVELAPQFRSTVHERIDDVAGNATDPAVQYEKRIPFPVLEGANGATVNLFLGTDAPGASAPSGTANLAVDVLDPNGAVLAKGSVDPANPTARIPVSALPGPGVYELHVYGVGADAGLAGASYTAETGVTYDGSPIARPVDASLPAATPTMGSGLVQAAITLNHPAPWTPHERTIQLVDADGDPLQREVEALATYTDAQGHLVTTTGWRTVTDGALPANVTFPAAGAYHVSVAVRAPDGSGDPLPTQVLSGVVHAGPHGEPEVTYPSTYRASLHRTVDALSGDDTTGRTHVATLPVRALDASTGLEVSFQPDADDRARFDVQVLGPDGQVVASETTTGSTDLTLSVEDVPAGRLQVQVASQAPSGASYDLDASLAYPEAPTEANPLYHAAEDADAASEGSGLSQVPGPSPLLVLAGLAAAGVLQLRRRRTA